MINGGLNASMITDLLLSGMFIGFFIALPFGGNAVLCTKNTLAHGWKSGLCTGLGAATAHTTYGFVGLSGLVAVKTLLSQHIGVLEITGGLFLCYFGISSIQKDLSEIKVGSIRDLGRIKTYIASTLFALANPKSIIVAGILITESGVFELIDDEQSISLMIALLGIFIGSTLWWLILVTSLNFLKKVLSQGYVVILNRAAGAIVILFGLFFSIRGVGNILSSTAEAL